jgi:CubicO group peptidase (beta-lactamase class C family)
MLPRTVWPHVFAAALVALASWPTPGAQAQGAPALRPEQRAHRIENGLVARAHVPADSTVLRSAEPAALSERMAFYRIPGVSIAVIDSFQIRWAKGYGLLKASGGASVTPHSRFEAASTSKSLVAAAVLHLVERGQLDLDTDVNTYLKSWKVPHDDFTREQKVTLRLLLTHRAGLPSSNMARDDGKPPTLVQILNGQPPARNKPAVVETVPGTHWEYSNIGYVVIQMILEDVTGKPLARIMDETVLQPLGMRSSTFTYPLAPKLRAEEAWPHDEEGTVQRPVMPPTALAQGGLISTPSDLARFAVELMLAYQGRSERLVSQATVRQMFQPQVDLDPSLLGMPASDGLGILLQGHGRGLSFFHPGENWPGATCWLVGYPETGQGAIIMTNGAKGNLLALEILQAIAREYGWPQEG